MNLYKGRWQNANRNSQRTRRKNARFVSPEQQSLLSSHDPGLDALDKDRGSGAKPVRERNHCRTTDKSRPLQQLSAGGRIPLCSHQGNSCRPDRKPLLNPGQNRPQDNSVLFPRPRPKASSSSRGCPYRKESHAPRPVSRPGEQGRPPDARH